MVPSSHAGRIAARRVAHAVVSGARPTAANRALASSIATRAVASSPSSSLLFDRRRLSSFSTPPCCVRTAPRRWLSSAAAAAPEIDIIGAAPEIDIIGEINAPKSPSSTAAASSPGVAACSTFGDKERFADQPNLHPRSKRAVSEGLGLTTMTEIQYKTFDAASSGRDVLGRARTGTGKTLAFLLPALETVLRYDDPPGERIGVLVLSPTRELAIQIGEQARALTSFHKGMTSQVVFGGSSKQKDANRFRTRLPTILVATPGRLQDHIENTTVHGESFADIVSRTRVLVLDETDRLLDMGFRNDIERILSYLPPDRQTLLFSATMPKSVRQIMADTMKPNHLTVDCIHDADPASHTNAQVDQNAVIVPRRRMVCGVVELLLHIMETDPDHKMVVFFPTTNLVSFYSRLFNHGLRRTVLEIHSKKSQEYRTSASNRFREREGGVMFTSDVSARGVDYPDVTHVVQVGMADSRETYIHRLGRTGRAGKKGKGILVLSETERGFLRTLNGLDVAPHEEYTSLVSSPAASSRVTAKLRPAVESIRSGTDFRLRKAAADAYKSMLGFYNGRLKQIGVSRSMDEAVRKVNSFAEQVGLDELPKISLRAARSMGLDRAKGLNIGHLSPRRHRPDYVREAVMGEGSYSDWGRGLGRGDGASGLWGGTEGSSSRTWEDRAPSRSDGGGHRGSRRGGFGRINQRENDRGSRRGWSTNRRWMTNDADKI